MFITAGQKVSPLLGLAYADTLYAFFYTDSYAQKLNRICVYDEKKRKANSSSDPTKRTKLRYLMKMFVEKRFSHKHQYKHCQPKLRTFCISTFPLKVGWLRDWGKLSDHQVSHFCSLTVTEGRISYLPFFSNSKMSIFHHIVHFSQTIYRDYPGAWRLRSFFFKKSRTVFSSPWSLKKSMLWCYILMCTVKIVGVNSFVFATPKWRLAPFIAITILQLPEYLNIWWGWGIKRICAKIIKVATGKYFTTLGVNLNELSEGRDLFSINLFGDNNQEKQPIFILTQKKASIEL